MTSECTQHQMRLFPGGFYPTSDSDQTQTRRVKVSAFGGRMRDIGAHQSLTPRSKGSGSKLLNAISSPRSKMPGPSTRAPAHVLRTCWRERLQPSEDRVRLTTDGPAGPGRGPRDPDGPRSHGVCFRTSHVAAKLHHSVEKGTRKAIRLNAHHFLKER